MTEPLFLSDDPATRTRILQRMNGADMLRHFGIQLDFPSETVVRARIDPVPDWARGGLQGSAVNGGVLSAMLDLALGMPGVTRAPDQPSGTMHLSLNFLRAVRTPRVDAEGWIERAGNGVIFTAARIVDADGVVCGTASGFVRLLTSG